MAKHPCLKHFSRADIKRHRALFVTKRCIIFDLEALALWSSRQATLFLANATRRLDKDYRPRFLKCPRNWLNFLKR